MMAQRGSRDIALHILYPRRWMGVGGQRDNPVTLPPGNRLNIRCTRGWVGPRAYLDGYGNDHPHQDSIPGTASP
jgi:hypothetical protein